VLSGLSALSGLLRIKVGIAAIINNINAYGAASLNRLIEAEDQI
jgi:hypothetical protein